MKDCWYWGTPTVCIQHRQLKLIQNDKTVLHFTLNNVGVNHRRNDISLDTMYAEL